MNHAFVQRLRRMIGLASLLSMFVTGVQADDVLRMYGPGGPAPAMREAAAAFEKSAGIKVEVTAGPTGKWLEQAKVDADLCPRRPNFDHPCRLNIDQEWKAARRAAFCG